MYAFKKSLLAVAISTISISLCAQETPESPEGTIEEVFTIGKSVSYANNASTDTMLSQQTTLTSALAVIDNLPGVLINEGDTFGADDWSTTVSIRGFSLSLDEQQIGITIDSIANGNSNYGGGAKANRYIDTENLAAVEVSQGTADIASRSNEALGGTLNFTTIDPSDRQQMVVSYTNAEFDSRKYFVRYETGEIAPETYAWISLSSQESSDWVDQSAENTRDHIAAKLITSLGAVDLTAYASYDDTHEDNYQRVSLGQFEINPEWDRLNPDWVGIPYVDQVYRRGWSTLRENTFAYLQADYSEGGLELSGNVYFHVNEGRGDWIPPYIRDVTDDEGASESELVSGNTIRSGNTIGRVYFVDAQGVALAPIDGCVSSITFPYGGSGANADPACHADGAIPVGSYRHTHYEKERFGINGDFSWTANFGDVENTLRGGFWYEDYHREESRDWHKIIDSRSSFRFDHTPYLVQYDRDFPVETTMVYLEDSLAFGIVTARLGAKQFFVDVEAEDNFNGNTISVESDSDTLLSAGVLVDLPVDGLEVFAGYAENFAAVKDVVLERPLADSAVDFEDIEPETAENIDIGLRYSNGDLNASLTYYQIDFENRLIFVSTGDPVLGIDFGEEVSGGYTNVGGVESSGFEASLSYAINDNFSLYSSYTNNASEYVGDNPAFPTGNTVFGSVEEQFVVSLDWTRDKYVGGISAKQVGDRWLNAENTQRMDAYTVVDLYAGVSMELGGDIEQLDIRFTVNNLNDESYLGGVSGESAWIGAPRTAAVNIKVTF